ncbi:Alpha/beta hydrolase fold-1 [Coniochaeta sp. 2T2.1]|nr:Alpha/beta hydrolase fold-1 [Coniochaeta sp. 2T2.1]
MSKPTIVIVPGSWQKPIVWDNFRDVLNKNGYSSFIISRPSVGGTTVPLAGLAEDVAAVRDVLTLLAEQGEEIVVLCHSSGGVVASNAVEGFDVTTRKTAGKTGGVVRLVLLSAFVVPKGKSLWDLYSGGKPASWTRFEGDRTSVDPEGFSQIIYSDLSPEEKTRWAKELTHTATGPSGTPSGYEPWKNGVACSYIYTSNDPSMALALQYEMVERLGPETLVGSVRSGHCPFLSMPERLLEALESVCPEISSVGQFPLADV